MAAPLVKVHDITSKEQDNFIRLCRLLIVGGTRVLRDVLDNIHPTLILHSKLEIPSFKGCLLKKTNSFQTALLYPSPGKFGKSEDFDISLIVLLLQSIRGTFPENPTQGWNRMPPEPEQTLAADIVRVKVHRNEVYAHTTAMKLTDAEFDNLWDKLSETLVRIVSNYGEDKRREWMNEVHQYLVGPLTETDRQNNIQELERWHLQDIELKQKLSKMEKGIDDIKDALGEIKSLNEHHKDLPLNYVCYDCKRNTGDLCASIDHRIHKVNGPELLEARQDIKDEILTAQNKLTRIENEIQAIAKKYDEETDHLKNIESMIHTYAEKCVNEIRKQEQQLLKAIEQSCHESRLDVENIKSRLSKQNEEICNAIDCARVLQEKGDAFVISHEANSIKETLKELSNTEIILKPLSCERKAFVDNSKLFDDLFLQGFGRILAIDPRKCTAIGPGVDPKAEIYQGLETSFTLSAQGEIINVPSEAISVFVDYRRETNKTHDIVAGQDVSRDVIDNGDGSYIVSYVPPEIGAALVSVKIEGEDIGQGPFEVNVKKRKYEALCSLGKRGTGNGNFKGPWGSAENSNGITDRDNNRVQVFNKEMSWKQTIGELESKEGQLLQPRGIAVDRHDDVIVVDNGNNRVQIFDKHGSFKMKFGGPGIAEGFFQNPYSVAIDDDQNLIISDADNKRIQIFTPNGQFVKSFGKGIIKASYYCIYHKGQYIVSDCESLSVKLFNKDGQFLHEIGRSGTGDGEFDKWIRGLGIDRVGNLLVCDSYADRIQVFRPVGSSFEFIDKFGKEGKKLGELKRPMTITVLRSGRFIVCEFMNCRVQMF